jgi:hypothetical protein
MALSRFHDIFVVINNWLEFLFNGVHKFGSEPDIGFQHVSKEIVSGISFFFQLMQMSMKEMSDVHQKVCFLLQCWNFRVHLYNSIRVEWSHGHSDILPIATNCFGLSDKVILVIWGNTLIMSRKSSIDEEIVRRLTCGCLGDQFKWFFMSVKENW